jgi:cytochrome d ubiquinol oxidase subunit I
MGVLFAVGAVSGTILSFELGILWPGLMSRFGAIFGFPFTLEGFAFFIEAIFLGIYLYGWDRLTPRAHLLTGVPVALAGMASAWFVVTANSWMNDPTGFRLVGGRVTHVDPWAGIFNPATPTETTHMILAAYMVTGFGVAAVYAAAILRGKRDRYHRTGLRIGLTMGAVLAPVQGIVGDFSARYVASHQPIKLAAMEGVFHTAKGVPETLGGLDIAGKMRFAVHIPDGLSLLTHLNPHAEITGLDTVPADQRPPVNPVHLSFDLMVGIGFLLLFLALWAGWSWWRHRALPERRSFLLVALAAGPLATVALEAGWVTTEVGRQPWIVYHVMRVDQAVNTAPGLWVGLPVLVAIYGVLTAVLVVVLRRLAAVPLPLDEPTETDAVAVKVI